MRSLLRATPLVLLVLLSLSASACRRRAVEPITPAPTADAGAVTEDEAARRAREEEERRRLEDERRRAEEAALAERERLLAEARAALTAPVYFEFDAAELAEDARLTLEGKVPVLLANPGIRLRISGHTDSRGSDEYNIALGQRRAAMVKRYLEQRGIAGSRMEIVSFGEERPAVAEENEGAWAQNRRAEFDVLAGELTNVGGME